MVSRYRKLIVASVAALLVAVTTFTDLNLPFDAEGATTAIIAILSAIGVWGVSNAEGGIALAYFLFAWTAVTVVAAVIGAAVGFFFDSTIKFGVIGIVATAAVFVGLWLFTKIMDKIDGLG
jgi:hypothetical protein